MRVGRAGEAEKGQEGEKAEEKREKEGGRECARLKECGSIDKSNLLFSVPCTDTFPLDC